MSRRDVATMSAKLIADIQSDTESAVESIRRGNRSVIDGASSVTDTGKAFEVIEDQIVMLGGNVKNSIEYINAVTGAGNRILEAMKEVLILSEAAADESQNVSASTEEQTAAMHEMAEASGKLADLAQDLQNEVQKFKF